MHLVSECGIFLFECSTLCNRDLIYRNSFYGKHLGFHHKFLFQGRGLCSVLHGEFPHPTSSKASEKSQPGATGIWELISWKV